MEQMHARFVDNHRANLVQRVSAVMAIADELLSAGIIHHETYSDIRAASTNQRKMRELLDALRTNKAESAFYSLLKKNDPYLAKDLEQQDARFVDDHRALPIQKVNALLQIFDALKSVGIINHDTFSKIQEASTNKDKMREVFDVLSTELPSMVEDLEQGGRQGIKRASSEVLEIEPRPKYPKTEQTIEQKTEEKQIRCNNSSKRYRTKVVELSEKKLTLKKVGNLYFSKDKKYIIGSGISSTVYLGLCEDGTEVAIKRITKNPENNNKDFENELKLLQDLKLESKNIVRYVTFAEDEDFYYLANQLCEYDLEEYMENLRQQEQKVKENTLRKKVKEMLLGLQVLHSAGVIHRDIKPGNVLIDTEERARLADFGISRKLDEGKTTVYTDRAGTKGWEATEIVNQTDSKGRYKPSSDIQVAGMLIYYILSDGKHPFGDLICREGNILIGKYSLIDVQDKKATDLIEWMISKDQEKRPTIDKVLDHPYFWDDKRIREVIHNLGNKEEIQNYKNYESNKVLYDAVQKYTSLEKSFSNWKSKAPVTWTKIGKSLPNDLLGLLRYLRNALGHQEKLFYEEKMIDEFPDFLISLHRLATDMGWEY